MANGRISLEWLIAQEPLLKPKLFYFSSLTHLVREYIVVPKQYLQYSDFVRLQACHGRRAGGSSEGRRRSMET